MVILALGLAACGSDSAPVAGSSTSPSSSNEAVCASRADLQDAFADLRALDPTNTTLGRLTTTSANLLTAGAALLSAAKDDVSIDTTALSQAWDSAKAAIRDIPGSGQSARQALESLKDSLEPLDQAVSNLRANCDGGAGTTTS